MGGTSGGRRRKGMDEKIVREVKEEGKIEEQFVEALTLQSGKTYLFCWIVFYP